MTNGFAIGAIWNGENVYRSIPLVTEAALAISLE